MGDDDRLDESEGLLGLVFPPDEFWVVLLIHEQTNHELPVLWTAFWKVELVVRQVRYVKTVTVSIARLFSF